MLLNYRNIKFGRGCSCYKERIKRLSEAECIVTWRCVSDAAHWWPDRLVRKGTLYPDLAKGYWQVSEACVKTAFSSPLGLFQFTVIPFGLQGAPATFQRLMDSVIAGLDSCAAYLDDLIVYSGAWNDHLVHLEQVFSRLKQAGFSIS